MNGRTARRLRREAQAPTTSMPARQFKRATKEGVIFNEPETTRAFYRHLKRSHLAARR